MHFLKHFFKLKGDTLLFFFFKKKNNNHSFLTQLTICVCAHDLSGSESSEPANPIVFVGGNWYICMTGLASRIILSWRREKE